MFLAMSSSTAAMFRALGACGNHTQSNTTQPRNKCQVASIDLVVAVCACEAHNEVAVERISAESQLHNTYVFLPKLRVSATHSIGPTLHCTERE